MRLAAIAVTACLLASACALGRPATAVTFNLPDKQVEVPIDQVIKFDFANPVDPKVAASHVSFDPTLHGPFTLLPDGRTLTFEPLAWVEGTTYQVRVASFNDLRGNQVAGQAWSFTTTVVPRVDSVHDDAGTALGPGLQVEQGSHVTLVFNTSMSPASTSVTANGKPA